MSAKLLDEEAVFHAARKITDRAARALFIGQACGDNLALAERVRVLLELHEQEPESLNSPPEATQTFVPVVERAGARIGAYVLREQIGEGGFGLVFVAEQTEPVKRRVALKIIKPGMDSKAVIARFEAERQAIALMEHPNIARVFDAGATETGRPYFVMELVRGIPITNYCDQNQLTPNERLDLFVDVCHAIQHAHQKGVIHRDVKPSNILVTSHDGKPVVKVIDFGVAKAIHQHLTDKTIYTQFTQMIGTPAYMSPEQAEMSGLDVDTRADIYSLGVLLYELLTGSTPLERKRLATVAYDEIRRLIREEEPPKPSHRLSTCDTLPSLAASRKTEPAKLSRMLKGELDWVVMKALEKDRTRRYETASGLAKDIQHYLRDEPVEARPPSFAYVVRKFARRHRAAVSVGAIVTAVLALVLVNHFISYVRLKEARGRAAAEFNRAQLAAAEAREERDRALTAEDLARKNEATALKQEKEAQRRAAEAQALMGFLDTLIWEGSEVIWEKPRQRNRSFFEALAAAEPRIGEQLSGHPLAEAQLRTLLGDLYADNADKLAIKQYEKALKLWRQELGPDDERTFYVMNLLAEALEWEEDWGPAIAIREECMTQQTRVHGSFHPHTFRQRIAFARVITLADQRDRGQAVFDVVERDFGALKARSADLEVKLVEQFKVLGDAYRQLNEKDKARRWYDESGRAFNANPERFAKEPRAAAEFVVHLAIAHTEQKQLADALHWYERFADALASWKRSDGLPFPGYYGLYCDNLIDQCNRAEDLERVAGILLKLVTFVRGNPPHSFVPRDNGNAQHALARSLKELGRCRLKQGKHAEAEAALSESLQIRKKWMPDLWTTYETWCQLGGSLLGQKKYAEAEKELLAGFNGLKERVYQMSEDEVAPRFWQVTDWLIELYTALGKPDEAAKWRDERAKYVELAPLPREKK